MSTSRTPPAAAAATVASESTARVTGRPAGHHRSQPAGVHHLVGQQQVVPSPAAAIPSTSRMVAQVNPACPAAAWRAASAVVLWAFTWGRRRAPGRAAAMTARLWSRAVRHRRPGPAFAARTRARSRSVGPAPCAPPGNMAAALTPPADPPQLDVQAAREVPSRARTSAPTPAAWRDGVRRRCPRAGSRRRSGSPPWRRRPPRRARRGASTTNFPTARPVAAKARRTAAGCHRRDGSMPELASLGETFHWSTRGRGRGVGARSRWSPPRPAIPARPRPAAAAPGARCWSSGSPPVTTSSGASMPSSSAEHVVGGAAVQLHGGVEAMPSPTCRAYRTSGSRGCTGRGARTWRAGRPTVPRPGRWARTPRRRTSSTARGGGSFTVDRQGGSPGRGRPRPPRRTPWPAARRSRTSRTGACPPR